MASNLDVKLPDIYVTNGLTSQPTRGNSAPNIFQTPNEHSRYNQPPQSASQPNFNHLQTYGQPNFYPQQPQGGYQQTQGGYQQPQGGYQPPYL